MSTSCVCQAWGIVCLARVMFSAMRRSTRVSCTTWPPSAVYAAGAGRARPPPAPALLALYLLPRLHRLAFLGEDLAEDARHRRRALGVDLVRVHLEHRLELDHLVARLDQPLRDGPFVDRLTELRHHDSRRLACHFQ